MNIKKLLATNIYPNTRAYLFLHIEILEKTRLKIGDINDV